MTKHLYTLSLGSKVTMGTKMSTMYPRRRPWSMVQQDFWPRLVWAEISREREPGNSGSRSTTPS